MILHAQCKNTFSKWRFGFLLPSETPPHPRFGKRPDFFRVFFRNPSLREPTTFQFDCYTYSRYYIPLYPFLRVYKTDICEGGGIPHQFYKYIQPRLPIEVHCILSQRSSQHKFRLSGLYLAIHE